MTERQLTQRFLKQLKKEFPQIYWYKIGDTFGGHKKPCDMIGCSQGKFLAIEFKKDDGKLSENQIISLEELSISGARCFIGVFKGKGLTIYDFSTPEKSTTLIYFKGRYEKVEKFISRI